MNNVHRFFIMVVVGLLMLLIISFSDVEYVTSGVSSHYDYVIIRNYPAFLLGSIMAGVWLLYAFQTIMSFEKSSGSDEKSKKTGG